MNFLIISFFTSLITTLLIVRYAHLHEHVTGDSDLDGPQKFHNHAVPRVGGLALFFALCIACLCKYLLSSESIPNDFFFLLLSSIPAFVFGLAEDLTKKISIKQRLFATGLSALITGIVLNTWITRIDIPGVDYLLSIPAIYILFTCIAVAGLANAYNIIDGFNGLASMVAMISLGAIGFIGFKVQDPLVMLLCLTMIGAIAGFFIWNYPRGLIFLGDGGAYLIGFWVATCSILLVVRHKEVSPWFALLVNAYPIFETLFTMWRRKIHQGKNPGLQDGAHFHTIVYRRIVRWAENNHSSKELHSTSMNARTSPYLWLLSSFAVIPAIAWWNNTVMLVIFSLLFCITYVWLYARVVKFNTPKWMKK
jgi:UDP-N-acetylmuramyl pentapeptide phosphotransferase/UDP-N-acetylglucosamine-1-phosphate transferase